MGLRMPSPFKHPATGIYWFRRRVPADLLTLVGKREEKVSLNTRDPAEAKAAWARVAVEVEARWSGLRGGVQSLTHRQMHALAGEIYQLLVTQGEAAQISVADLRVGMFHDQTAMNWKSATVVDGFARSPDGGPPKRNKRLREVVERQELVRDYLTHKGVSVRPEDLDRLTEIVARALMQGRRQLIRQQEGDYRPDPDAARFPPWQPKAATAPESDRPEGFYDLVTIYEKYAEEAEHAVATRKKWKGIVADVAATHPDIRKITDIWAVEWKDALLKRGLSTRSVQEGYLAALKSTCAWAVKNKRITENPFDGISVKVIKASKERGKGYADSEAAFVLSLTLKPVEGKVGSWMRSARRWVPWLCAYSGARVGEIAQLRKEDVQQEFGVWVLWVTPEAGTTKTGDARWVALHPHLVEQGFLDFVAGSKPGPLFYNPVRTRNGTPENPPSKKVGERLGEWIRDEGFTDKRVAPNHGWRHRFKTISRDHGMDAGARDYMQGHAAASEGEAYGEFRPGTLLAEISKLPAYNLPGLVLPKTKYEQPMIASRVGDLVYNSMLAPGSGVLGDAKA